MFLNKSPLNDLNQIRFERLLDQKGPKSSVKSTHILCCLLFVSFEACILVRHLDKLPPTSPTNNS